MVKSNSDIRAIACMPNTEPPAKGLPNVSAQPVIDLAVLLLAAVLSGAEDKPKKKKRRYHEQTNRNR